MRIQKIFVHIVLLLVVVRLELHSSLYGNNPLVNRPYRFFWTGPICTFQGSLTTFFLKHIASLNLKYKGEQVSYYTGAPECPKSWWGQALINQFSNAFDTLDCRKCEILSKQDSNESKIARIATSKTQNTSKF